MSSTTNTSPPPTDPPPSPQTLQKVESHTVLDHHGNPHPFKDLYSGPSVTNRTLVIFVRHFFCGSCQEFLRSLSSTITPDILSHAPISTSITIIGCGDPALIPTYTTETNCPYPIYADPERKLYTDLGMHSSLALGPRPEYIKKGFLSNTGGSVWQIIKQVPSGLAGRGGPSGQNGGEFLFEGEGGRVSWCHVMGNTRDHTEVEDLGRVLGIAGVEQGEG